MVTKQFVRYLFLWLTGLLAIVLFLVGLLIPAEETRGMVAPIVVPITFVVCLLVVLLAYAFGLIASEVAQLLALILGRKIVHDRKGLIFIYVPWGRLIALCFAGFGLGAVLRSTVWHDQAFSIGGTFLALAAGLVCGFAIIGRLDSLRGRRAKV